MYKEEAQPELCNGLCGSPLILDLHMLFRCGVLHDSFEILSREVLMFVRLPAGRSCGLQSITGLHTGLLCI